MTDLLWKFCHHGDASAREEAYQEILKRRDEILPNLVEEVDSAIRIFHHTGLARDRAGKILSANLEPLHRLAELIASFQHAGSLLPLTKILLTHGDDQVMKLFCGICDVLERRASPDDIAALLLTLATLRKSNRLELFMLFEGKPLVCVGEALVRLAEQGRYVEIRAALPLLKPHWLDPESVKTLHRRLQVVYANEALPIPTTAVQTREQLPIPAEDEAR